VIRIILLYEGTQIIGMEVKGHSGFAPKGSDIICSAVSMITQSYALFLAKKGWLKDIEKRDGYMKVISRKGSSDITILLEEGLYSLWEKYKSYIMIEEVRYGT